MQPLNTLRLQASHSLNQVVIIKTPKDFIWGTATAAHQVEGNNTNSDYWLLENTKDTIFVEPSGIACDQFNRYQEDIDIMAAAVSDYKPIEFSKIKIKKDNNELNIKFEKTTDILF